MENKNTVNWAIIAPGHIAHKFGEALSYLSKSDSRICCYAVASRDETRAKEFASAFNFKKVYGSYEELFADPEVDIVYIASPHTFHTELSMQALKAGKNVICEKPAGVNAFLLQQIIDYAQDHNLFFMEATWTCFNPTVLKVMDWIRSGSIGNILAVNCSFCFRNEYNQESRLFNPDLAGGALLDVGIYPVTFSMMVAKAAEQIGKPAFMSSAPIKIVEPRKVTSIARISKGVDLSETIVLNFASGIVAQLQSAVDLEPAENSKDAYIYGTKGYIKVPYFWMAQEAALYTYSSAAGRETEESHEVFENKFLCNGYEYEILDATDCLLKQRTESSLHSNYDSISIIKVLDNLRGQWKLEYPFEKQMIEKAMLEENQNNETTQAEEGEAGNPDSPLIVYTDGGCSGNPGPGGWGCVIIDGTKEQRLSGGEKNTTNNRMELSAAINALSAVARNPSWKTREIDVFSDSQYVKNGITSWISSWKKNGWKTSAKKPVLNKELWEELDELYSSLNVKWQWVKGHAGIKYNEICDQLCQIEIHKNQ